MNIQDDSLDNLLNQWADDRAADSSTIDELQQRISLVISDNNARPSKTEQDVPSGESLEAPMSLPGQQPTVMPRPVWPL
ncbi:MAG: hypothetical protein ACKVHE_02185 [Planctomycetales bacterium]|jgi:hypothetical protein